MSCWKTASGLALAFVWLTAYVAPAQEQAGRSDRESGHRHQGRHEAKDPKLPACPVMGEPIDFSVSTMTDGGPVYFCCASCVEKFQKDPQKYAEKVAAQRELLRNRPRIQVNCPLSGEPIDKQVFTEQNGKKVYFCCADCKAKYEKEPAKYAGKLEASYTYQTRCPVMGGEIDPAVFTDLPTGQRIYFCCAGCENRLLKDPEKYAPQLAAQGVRIDVEKLKVDREAHDNHGKRGGKDRP